MSVLWSEEPRGRRGPDRSLSLEAITDAAMTIGDTEGLEAVSMARLGSELHVTTTALYRYLSSKDDVLALVADRMIPTPSELGPPDHDWRRAIEHWLRCQIELGVAHPWILGLRLTVLERGPRALASLDWAIGALAPSGLLPRERLDLAGLLANIALAQIRLRLEYQRAVHAPGSRGDIVTTIRDHLGDPRLQHLSAAYRDGIENADAALPSQVEANGESVTELGLRTVLDGVTALVERRRAAAGPEQEPPVDSQALRPRIES